MSQPPTILRTATVPVMTEKEQANYIRQEQDKVVMTPQLKFKLAKQRPLHFKARLTQFDLSNTDNSNHAFRGFYTLFWIAMGLYVITTFVRCYEQEGIILSLGFFRLFSKDGFTLLISDLIMVSMTLFSVLFSKLFLWNILPYESIGYIVQHVCQALFLFFNIYWTFFRYDKHFLYNH
jgi:sterol O-acyltransferase